jgi:hypothetical protein
VPSEGAITLNYDGLFEKACGDAGEPRFVIPNESGQGRWLLKLHGDANRPETIVLTRDDYLGFNANREALSSLVKAHLMTHHLLFVGFGLADDHFHEIVHAVHRALPEGGKRELGTAIMVAADGLHAKAWEGRLAMVRMTPDPVAKADFGVGARRLEIFLDAMMAHTTQEHTYLLAEKYGDSLASQDRELREDLLTLVAKHGGSDSPAWAVVRTALEGLGLEEPQSAPTKTPSSRISVPSQNVTDKDRTASMLRIPAASKHAFPPERCVIRMNVGGIERDTRWNPRPGDHRSGTLGVGIDVMRNLKTRNAPVWLELVDGVYHLVDGCPTSS